jgi:hypothetical protein
MDKKEEILRAHHAKLTLEHKNYITFEEGQAEQPELIQMVYDMMQDWSDHENKELIELIKDQQLISETKTKMIANLEKIIGGLEEMLQLANIMTRNIDTVLEAGAVLKKDDDMHTSLKQYISTLPEPTLDISKLPNSGPIKKSDNTIN